ncbi:ATP-binding protein [Evansella sp. AB-rgal1]|uniref:ATP-binding protein n=1 Tax=Evansella sp. AB-rgal1 TaxID=3242696 RepID=UPI00359D0809
MEWLFEDLLLNFLFLLFFLLLIPIVLEQSTASKKSKKTIMLFTFLLTIISCLTFPILSEDGYIFDLRYVGTIIGGLYGGVPATIVIWVVTNLYRFLFGGTGAWLNLAFTTSHAILLLYILRYFRRSPKLTKLMIGTVIAFTSSLLVAIVISLSYLSFSLFNIAVYIFAQTIAVAIIIYITEIIYETALLRLRTEKMDLVSQLASSISHEVRNPLTVVRGFLQLLSQTDLPHKKKQEYLNIAIEEIDRANSIIGDYLTFAKPQAAETKLLDTKKELIRALDVITPLANMNSVSIEAKIHSFMIYGESQLFQQCILNITKNCIEAMPNGGTLTLQTKLDNNNVILCISDTGVGMTEEQKSRLGEPYFTTKGKKGTGLGMMTVFRIIESLDGTLSITSELNKGSIFCIRVPLVKQKAITKNEEEVAAVYES